MNRIYAVDLGAWSIKVAVATAGLRGSTITQVVERLLPPAPDKADGIPASLDRRAELALAQVVRDLGLEHDTAYLGVYGDQVFTHVLEFGFKNLKRADLTRAVGAELEGVVPVDLEDMVYAFETLPPADRELLDMALIDFVLRRFTLPA